MGAKRPYNYHLACLLIRYLICLFLWAKQRGQNRKTAQSPQVWAVFEITAKTYFILRKYYTTLVQNSKG